MKVVLGLGNEGPEYRRTRHNVGFMVADAIALRTGASFAARGELGRVTWSAEAGYGGERIVLAKPRTLMNASGRAAIALKRKFGTDPSEMIVVYDDADLAFGRVRVRPEGGSGGHNGIRSLIDALGTQAFPRVKLGVHGEGRPGRGLADYVLATFRPDEIPALEEMIALAADAVATILAEGVEAAQRAYNRPRG